MVALLRLEIIGDDSNQRMRLWRRIFPEARQILSLAFPEPWVARITGLDDRYGLAREFVRARKDYTNANSVGSRGVFNVYWLENGLYEVEERISWRQPRRWFCRAEAGRIIRMTREEALEWLSGGLASTS